MRLHFEKWFKTRDTAATLVLDVPSSTSDREIVRRAKLWANWTGLSCKVKRTASVGLITIRPHGSSYICAVWKGR